LKKVLLSYFLLLIALTTHAQPSYLSLSGVWQMKAAADSNWHIAQVPGNVYLDLERQGRISNPLYGTQEKEVQWVDNTAWQYRKTFDLSINQLKLADIVLVFEGIDTHAEISLNGKKLASVDNMFRRWEYEVGNNLQKGKNELHIHFYPVTEVARKAAQNFPYPLPGGDAPYIRKAQYQFGWDWAPRLLGCGLWKAVGIEFRNKLQLKQPFVRIQLDSKLATVHVEGGLRGTSALEWEVETRIFTGKKWLVNRSKKENTFSDSLYNTVIEVPQPELWWPNGHGAARLYPVEVNLYVGKKRLDQLRFKTGLRTIKWIQAPDSIGSSFQLEVNGKPIFVKGANWVPPDQFPARISPDQYQRQVVLAADVGLNMLRVWGGGTYADEAFLDACDSLGILVWQDFMFACALYPADKAFLANVRVEASQQIERIRNRTSLALWCGNNEISEGWFNWHWQESLGYSPTDSFELYRQYEKLFHELIPQLISQNDPNTFYHPSSPSNGWGRDTAYKTGDVHYWGVWWGFESFENYRNKTGRFVSEYGFQGFPNLGTRNLMNDAANGASPTSGLAAHQKHPLGDSTIRVYMARDYPIPDDPEKFAYISQLLQARGMQIAMESHRFAQPYCMGSLFWQWNDCWPAISWSAIDYLAAPKAFYYQVKRSFAPTILRIDTVDAQLVFQIVSDQVQLKQSTTLQIQVGTLDGLLVSDTIIELHPSADKNQLRALLSMAYLPKHINKNRLYIRARALSPQVNVDWAAPLYFVAPKNLALQKPEIQWAVKAANQLVLTTNKAVKNLQIRATGLEFENNYFDLLPGEEFHVRFKQSNPEEKIRLHFRSLYDCF